MTVYGGGCNAGVQAGKMVFLNVTSAPEMTVLTGISSTERNEGIFLHNYFGRFHFPARHVAACLKWNNDYGDSWVHPHGSLLARCDRGVLRILSKVSRSLCEAGPSHTWELVACALRALVLWNTEPLVDPSATLDSTLWSSSMHRTWGGKLAVNARCARSGCSATCCRYGLFSGAVLVAVSPPPTL